MAWLDTTSSSRDLVAEKAANHLKKFEQPNIFDR